MTANYSELSVDSKPELYVTNLDFFALEEYLTKISTSLSYNAKAIHLILTDENTSVLKNLSSHHAAKVVFVNAESLEGYCENKKKTEEIFESDSSFLDLYDGLNVHIEIPEFSKPSEMIYCYPIEWPPYQLCVDNNCTGNKGLFLDALYYFADYLNVSVVFKKCEFFGCADYFDNAFYYDCDIVFSYLLERTGVMSAYPPWVDDFDYWYVPRPPQIPYWTYMFAAFPGNIWEAWILITISTSILKWTVEKIFRRNYSCKHIFLICLLTFKIFLEQEAKVYNNRVSEITISCVLLIGTFILNLAYKTRFTYLLLGSNYYSTVIQSINDAAVYKMYVTYAICLKDDLEIRYPDLGKYFEAHFIYTDSINWTDLVAYNKNTVALKNYISTRYVEKSFLDENGRPMINMLSAQVQKSYYSFHYARSHPQWSLFPHFLNALRDHGFLHLFESRYQYDGGYTNQPEIDSNYELGIGHLEGPFILWLFGNLIALICFLVERKRKK